MKFKEMKKCVVDTSII